MRRTMQNPMDAGSYPSAPSVSSRPTGRPEGASGAAFANQFEVSQWFSFMAKLDDPVKVDGKPMLPKGTLVEGTWRQFLRAARCAGARFEWYLIASSFPTAPFNLRGLNFPPPKASPQKPIAREPSIPR